MKLIKKFKKPFPNLNILIIFIAIVLIWRMVWSLMDIYFFPNHPIFSYIAGGVLGLIILWIDDFKITELN